MKFLQASIFSLVLVGILAACSNESDHYLNSRENPQGTIHLALQEAAEAARREQNSERDLREQNLNQFAEFYIPEEDNPSFSMERIEGDFDLLQELAIDDGRQLGGSFGSYELFKTANGNYILFHLTYPIEGEYYIQNIHHVPDEVAEFFEELGS
ncbi:hypothetical protein FLK61_40005 [Paenalkalicoccus suaedae]|uniref:Lipoprotein n=1 Tax=Paenalkalicoccus suaedae TaxID=2592382 RepID=A0A859FJB2_9BACI|nr:hypothetical protein [Paenalkalicoccus suaedae]QKS72796.1 hypothetical protein FLK61_40005 [Paenalkalicoccus suaedae]